MKVAAGIEYDGAGFCGWQFQYGVRTVQATVEEALSRVADAPVRVIAAGRTDTGVHACAQVIHFETESARSEKAWVRGSTSNLPADVSVLWAREVDDDFHARFSAQERAYRYFILNRPMRPTFLGGRVTWDYRPLDVDRMRRAAAFLYGTHDFNAFRATACQAKSPVRDLRGLEVRRFDDWVVLDAWADGFLHHMVRNLAGVLITIGAGEREPEWAREVLHSRSRAAGGVTAAPDGLYLARVEYPQRFGLPSARGSCGPLAMPR